MKNIKRARAIYYSKQEQKYKIYEKAVNDLNLRKEFEDFKKNFKCCYKNKVYYYFFKKFNINHITILRNHIIEKEKQKNGN